MSLKKNDLQTQLIKTFLGVIFYSQEKKIKNILTQLSII